jgi:very-short-patch-repair endonuclease
MTVELAAGAALVIDLLNYIEQVEKLKSKPAFSVPSEFFVAYQHELKGLPGLQYNLQVEGDDVWLRIPRLQEIVAPEVDVQLEPWITIPKSPDKAPELRAEVVTFEGKREIARERIEDHPNIRDIFHWYVEYQWEPWATAERPRRKTIARYNQLFSLQQAISSDGAETSLELAWGMGYAAWKKEGFATPIKCPLLVQSCEVTLNEKTFDLEVRPREVEPRLEADCYAEMELPGVKQLEAYWCSALTTGANRVNPFEASTFEGTLKAAVGHLDPSGAYEVRSDDVTPPPPTDKLKMTNTWVLFGRKRSGDIFLEDIRRLKKKVEEATTLPSVIRSFVERGDSTVRVRSEQPFRGLSTSDGGSNAMELYFPMAYNDEQVSIVQKLYGNDGVVVQGPPGTGKTHTIANVICHYLAQGKRVLVTAKGESALAVLQEKLPEGIRPLSVALLSDERDGMKQFEHSIQAIASSVASINPTRAAANIAAADSKLNQLHAKISHVDRTVTAYAGKHMQSYAFQGREVTPEEMAKLVLEQADAHQWFDDEPPSTGDGVLPFDENAVNALRRARMTVSDDLGYVGGTLPALDDFPVWSDILGLHRDLVQAKAIDASVTQGRHFALVDSRLETFEKAQTLAKFLDDRMALKVKLAGAHQPWLEVLSERFADMQPNDPVLIALLEVCGEVRKLERKRRELVAKAVEVPVDADLNGDFTDAVVRLIAGKSAFALPFGKGEARKLIALVSVTGIAPVSQGDWELVQTIQMWRKDARKVLARWTSLSMEFGLEAPAMDIESGFKKVAQWQTGIEDVRQLTFEFDAKLHLRMEEVFGKKTADRMWDGGEPFVASVYASLQAHIDKGRLAYAMKRVQELVRKLDGHCGGIVDELRSFLAESLGRITADESVLQTTWLALQAELSRLTALRPALDEISRVTAEIEAAGATQWAKRLRVLAASPDLDTLTPVTWLDAWNWRQAVILLDRIDGHHKLRELFDERKTLTTALARTYQELVAEKTWLGVFNNSPDSVRQALQAYLNAVQAMGAGTGVRAVRHRKTARESMLRAYQAVPCWVLPQWRVSETLPPEIGLFDLVVIDEASQSDIWALPALLRGQKVLVVGDHKQVSPSAIGTAEEKIKELVNRFLTNQPHGSDMTPDKSIYDLARVVFAGNSVMLKEHFRCVPAIIEFSNREFYAGDIRPLRLPKANERLDPPLVDVFVKGGFRKGDVNDPEAKAVVDEIVTILADPQFEGRSIGVVTLLGTAQAALIHKMVSERISPVDVVARKIAVGPPPVFQGRERDIMLVSMVLGPGDRSAANRADMHQRFNVALSRARDRMYLFRSVGETEFREDSLNGKVISHFKQPFRQDIKKVQALREKCESGFEIEMFDELVKRSFRVEPQVPCGGYRIDFVVEGNEGRRLAIECDGDRFHGPGQWQDDMSRQRVLERAGWTFWRCFASSFVRRRQTVIDDLMQTLERLGIEPLGAESVDNTVWVHSKEADPYGVEEAQEQEAV